MSDKAVESEWIIKDPLLKKNLPGPPTFFILTLVKVESEKFELANVPI
jgi:hypothetical protein